jgi:hypothetical protein
MAITTVDALIAGMVPPRQFLKSSATAEGAGTWHSLFLLAGTPGAGATPPAYTAGSGYTCDRTTQGAFDFVNPGGGSETVLARVGVAGATVGTLIVYDRLWTCSGLTTAAAATLNVTTPGTIPSRDANGATAGAGVELWGEVYTAPGATAATWTVSYTNQAGTSGRTATYSHPANAESVGQMFPFTLAAGDTGVGAVASFTTSISSGTAGSIGLTLMRRLATVPITTANVGATLDALGCGAPVIYDSSCLALMVMASTTNTGIVNGELVWSQG